MFHPLLMVTYGVILALSFTYLAIYPPTMKMLLVGGAFLSTAVVPGIFIFLMVKNGAAGDLELTDRKERGVPYLIIITSSYFVLKDWEKVVYGFVTLYVCSFVLDQIVNSARQSVQFFIISKKYQEIGKEINALHRGVTVIDATGLYTGQEQMMMFVLAKKRQSTTIFRIINDIDPTAFVSQSAGIGGYGEGFDHFKLKKSK